MPRSSERIGQQLIQSIPGWTYKGRWWQRLGWRKRRAIELLHRVGIKDHKDAMRSFPYQLTEGECQKVMIAIALGQPAASADCRRADQRHGADHPGADYSPADAAQPEQQHHHLADQP